MVAVLNRLVARLGAPEAVFVNNDSEFTGRLMDLWPTTSRLFFSSLHLIKQPSSDRKMQGLLSLIETSEQAVAAINLCAKKNVTINHRKHDEELTPELVDAGGFSINFGGYGSYSRIGLGNGFSKKWVIKGFEDPRGKPFTGLSVFFHGTSWQRPLSEMEETLTKMGGEIAATLDGADIIVFSDAAPQLPHSQISLVVTEALLQESLPAVKGKAPSAPRATKALGRDSQNLWKLLSARDVDLVAQGISLAAALDSSWEDLLDGVDVAPATGTLERGPRFTGTGPSQVYLDVALLGLLSVAVQGTRGAELRRAVKALEITVSAIPALNGYDALERLSITLSTGVNVEDLSALGCLPALRALSLSSAGEHWQPDRATLASLNGLDAPSLTDISVVNLNLTSADALAACRSLVKVDLGGNAELANISGLSGSVSTLRDVSLKGCTAIDSLEPMSGVNLERLILEDCQNIESLTALSECSAFSELSLKGCQKLMSLAGIAGKPVAAAGKEYGGYEFSLAGCSALESIVGLPRLDEKFKSLRLDLTSITTLDGIDAAGHITNLSASAMSLHDISHIAVLKNLENVSFSYSEDLKDATILGQLEKLEIVSLSSCSALEVLPAIWKSPLRELDVTGCSSLTSLGGLSTSLECLGTWGSRIDLSGCTRLESIDAISITSMSKADHVDLSGCDSLASLSGLDILKAVKTVVIPPQIRDASALKGQRGLVIINLGDELKALPATLGKALEKIPKLAICVRNAERLEGCDSLSGLANITSVDLTAAQKLKDLRWMIGLPALETLKLHSASPAAKLAKAAKFDSLTKVRKLQSALCAELKLPPPAHLDPAASKKVTAARTSSLLIKELKAGLTSASIEDVRKALVKLASEGDAAIFDQLVEGASSGAAFNGNSEAMGKIFKGVKAGDRGTARLALASILAMAPDDAVDAAKIRSEVTEMDIEFPESSEAGDVPPLGGFQHLETLSLSKLPGESLLFCQGLSSLKTIMITDAPELKSLDGLGACSGLGEIQIRNAEKLTGFDVLEGLHKLSDLSLSSAGHITRLGFVKGLKSVTRIALQIAADANLEPFESAPWMTDVSLTLQGMCPVLDALHHVETLSICGCPSGYWFDDDAPKHEPIYVNLDVSLPSLRELTLRGGIYDFRKLRAPSLEKVSFWGRCIFPAEFRGLATREDVRFASWGTSSCEAATLEGLDACTLGELDLIPFKDFLKDLSGLKDIASLRKVSVPVFDAEVLATLPTVPQVEHLVCRNFEGSLAWIAAFKGVKIIELQEAGELVQMDVLASLPMLESIRLKGAKTKRESWPDSLQAKLDYRR